MAGNSATLVVKIISDAKGATAGVDAAAQRFGKVGTAAKKAMVPATALGIGLLAGAKKAVDAASRTQQAMGGLDAVFGSNADQMKKWSRAAADSVGLSQSAYGELATLIGAQLKNAGVPMDQLADKTNGLIKTGADLAAMYGGTTADSVAALSSALKGEFDPMEKYGTSLSAAKIKAEMMAQGTDKLTGKAYDAAKAQATLGLITKQTADAHGAAKREYDSAASAQQRLAAKTENMASDLGTVLLPVVSMFANALAKVAGLASKNAGVVQVLAAVLAGLVVAVYAVNAAMAVYNAVSLVTAGVQKLLKSSLLATRIQLVALAAAEKIAAIAQWALNAAMSANPIMLVVIAVALLVAGFVLLYKKSKTFRNFVNSMWSAIKSGAQAAAAVLKAAWSAVWSLASNAVRRYLAVARGVLTGVRAAVAAVVSRVQALVQWFKNLKVPPAIRAAVNAVKSAVESAIAKVKSLVATMGNIKVPGVVLSALHSIEGAIGSVIGRVSDLIGWLSRIKVPKINLPGGKSGPKSAAAASPAVGFRAVGHSAGRAASPVAGPSVVIQVTGALDPEGVARQIRRILDGHDRRVGLVRPS